ncbi:hypothetical protein SLE2022_025880 [Rubroshorea leprosula]
MLEYEWGNATMLSGEEPTQEEADPTRQIFDYTSAANQQPFNETFLHQQNTVNAFSHHNHNHFHNPAQAHLPSIYDPRAYSSASAYCAPHSSSLLSLDPVSGGSGSGYFLVPKTEEVARSPLDFTTRIGLNLGGRTYFSSAEDDFVNRLYRRSRHGDTGSTSSPQCQAEGCNADLTHAKHYHRRHKVCEFHSKAATVMAAGLTQRFCQQCSRFHLLSEFDNGKRSCRKRLADHNRRRRKSQQQPNHESQKSQPEAAGISSPDYLAKSPPDSGVNSSSSVTVAVSPPRMSLDCFRKRSYHAVASSSSPNSLFFSSG